MTSWIGSQRAIAEVCRETVFALHIDKIIVSTILKIEMPARQPYCGTLLQSVLFSCRAVEYHIEKWCLPASQKLGLDTVRSELAKSLLHRIEIPVHANASCNARMIYIGIPSGGIWWQSHVKASVTRRSGATRIILDQTVSFHLVDSVLRTCNKIRRTCF